MSIIKLVAMGLLVPTGPMQTYKDTRTGETLVDDQGGPRVAGGRGYGLTDNDQDYNGDDQDYSGREERIENRLERLDNREDRHDKRVGRREDRHDRRVDRKRDRLESKLDDDDDDRRGGKNKVKPKSWYAGNSDWQADARGGVTTSAITAADQTHTVTIKVGAKSFKAFDMSFSGSTDTDAVVTRIEFGEEAVFSTPAGVSISLWDANSTLRDFLANTGEIVGGLDITVTFISGGGSAEAPKKIRAALLGFKRKNNSCD